MVQFLETVFAILALTAPILFITHFQRKGVLISVIWFWGIIMISGVVFKQIDPTRDQGEFSMTWVLLGLMGALVYCLPLYVVIQGVRAFAKKFRSPHQQ